MKETMDFLNKAGVYYLATTDSHSAHVRPIGFVMDWNGKLAFCTANSKPMYQQLVNHPMVEVCCFNGGNTLRISGKATIITSPETQAKALEIMPNLSHIYSIGDGLFEIYCLEDAKALWTVFNTGETREVSL